MTTAPLAADARQAPGKVPTLPCEAGSQDQPIAPDAKVQQQRALIEREAARSYRGDKRRAYKALVGHERAFADLVVKVSAPRSNVDLDQETTRILRAAA